MTQLSKVKRNIHRHKDKSCNLIKHKKTNSRPNRAVWTVFVNVAHWRGSTLAIYKTVLIIFPLNLQLDWSSLLIGWDTDWLRLERAWAPNWRMLSKNGNKKRPINHYAVVVVDFCVLKCVLSWLLCSESHFRFTIDYHRQLRSITVGACFGFCSGLNQWFSR